MPERASQKTIIVVPCYNEETRFPKQSFLDFINRVSGIKFLFVDDGSKDQTFKILEGLRQENPDQIDVLKLPVNSGKAEAVRKGFLRAFECQPEFLAFWDCDLATPLELLPSFIEIFKERPKVEMVFGARVKLMGRNIQRRLHRHYLGRIFATFASLVLNLSIYDTQCGAKMFRNTETLKSIFSEPFKSKWIFDVELLARYLKQTKSSSLDPDTKIYELPLTAWHDVRGSKLKPADFAKAFVELVKIYITYR